MTQLKNKIFQQLRTLYVCQKLPILMGVRFYSKNQQVPTSSQTNLEKKKPGELTAGFRLVIVQVYTEE